MFVKFRGKIRRAIFFEPCVAGVADDLEEPRAWITSVVGSEKPQRAEHGFLGDVFCVVAVANDPTRQIEGRIYVRHHDLLEPLGNDRVGRRVRYSGRACVRHGNRLIHRVDRRELQFIPRQRAKL
jgi:hypothetical protein